ADDHATWAAEGFAVGGYTQLGSVVVRFEGSGRGIVEWTVLGAVVEGETIDGLVTRTSAEIEPITGRVPKHANGTVSIDHVVVATPDWSRTIDALDAAGFDLRRERAAGTERAPMRQGFFRAGEVIIEVVGSREPSGDGPAQFFGLALNVADLDATARYFGDRT